MKLKKIINTILLSGFLTITPVIIWQYQLIGYGLAQLKGQLQIVWNAKPIEEALIDPSFPDSMKMKLILIQEIKAFATDKLGINDSKNYTKVYHQEGKTLLWVLTASEPYCLKAKEWNFPFLGAVSYKGFFNQSASLKEEAALKAAGYDIDMGKVSGWSTLGWFEDPILSDMLKNSEGDLANLIIHELTHATLYVKDNVDFNENLASFIGDKGALLFLEYKFGKDSKPYREYIESRTDEEIFNNYILNGAGRLDSLYNTFGKKDSRKFKENKKSKLIHEIVSGIEELPLYNKELYLRIAEKARMKKNAFFMSYMRYGSKLNEFEDEYATKFNADLKAYLEHLKVLYPSL